MNISKNRIINLIVTFTILVSLSINLLAATATPQTNPVNIHYISTGNSDCILISKMVNMPMLSKYKVTTYRTDINGTVKVTSDGKNITITTENKATDKAVSSPTNNTTTTNTTDKKQETSTTQPITTTVYITKTGEKYHKDGCSSLGKSEVTISL